MKFVYGLLIGLTLLSLVTCSSGPNEITAKELIGNWRVMPEGSYVQFKSDGTYSIGWSIDGLESAPVEQGRYTLEGTLFTFISSEESLACSAGARGFYEMERSDDGGFRQIIQEDECTVRGSTGTVTLERVP